MHKEFINQSFRELYNQAVFESDLKAVNALVKAADVIETTDYSFDGETLKFTSPASNKPRIVTKFGCHVSCDCKGTRSYHFQMFWILRRAWLRFRHEQQSRQVLGLAGRVGRSAVLTEQYQAEVEQFVEARETLRVRDENKRILERICI